MGTCQVVDLLQCMDPAKAAPGGSEEEAMDTLVLLKSCSPTLEE